MGQNERFMEQPVIAAGQGSHEIPDDAPSYQDTEEANHFDTFLGTPVVSTKQRNLQDCFSLAKQKFVDNTLKQTKEAKLPKRKAQLDKFFKETAGTAELMVECEKIAAREEPNRLMMTLERIQIAGDNLTSSAPDLVGVAWFGVSTLISV